MFERLRRLQDGDTIESRAFDLFLRILVVFVAVFILIILYHMMVIIGLTGILISVLVGLAWWGLDLARDYHLDREKLEMMKSSESK